MNSTKYSSKGIYIAYDDQDDGIHAFRLDYSLFYNRIPSLQTASQVQNAIETALNGFTESDPVFSASPAAGITSQNIASWDAKSNFSGSYNDLTNKPTIPEVPTNVSTFTNDSGYQNSTQVQSAINTAIGNINSFEVAVVSSLPASDIQDHTIYFVPQAVNSSTHDEYMYINNN